MSEKRTKTDPVKDILKEEIKNKGLSKSEKDIEIILTNIGLNTKSIKSYIYKNNFNVFLRFRKTFL